MRRRKEGKVPPLNFTACSPGGLFASLRASSPEVPGGTGGGGGKRAPGELARRILTCRLYTYRFTTVLRCSRSDASLAQRTRKVSTTSSPRLSPYISDDDGDGNENGQKAIV